MEMDDTMNTLECISTRRSIRNYCKKKVDEKTIKQILDMAILAPSGKNLQPWKLKVIDDFEKIKVLSELDKNNSWMESAPVVLSVFLDKTVSYNYKKDLQSSGALIQNILLTANAMGLGSCWLGGIVSKESEIKNILGINDNSIELMALITLGYPMYCYKAPIKKSLDVLLIE